MDDSKGAPPVTRSRGRFGESFRPATLGSTLAAHLQLIVWCKDCRHQVEPDVSEQVERYGSGAEPKKKARATAATTKKKKPAAPKKSAPKQPTSAGSEAAFEPTDEQIRLRAYFLAERRHRLSLPGDSNHDWIEARRQLIDESQRSAG